MATAPELPFLAAGAVAIVGGVKREGHFPSDGFVSVIGTCVLVLVASATTGTRVAPLVRAIGLVLLLGAVYGTARAFQTAPSRGPKGTRGKSSPRKEA